MKKNLIIILLTTFISSCAFNQEQDGYNFDNFKGTPVWELAQAVKDDDGDEVCNILKNKKVVVDYKDPIFKQTLLSLSIQNNKRNAFLQLLKAGANPNELLGNSLDETPFIGAIIIQENCDMYYIENLLIYGANPNIEIKNHAQDNFNDSSLPLLVAIGKTNENGDECLDLIKYLVDNGANIDICYENPTNGICEGVITSCLMKNSMETLRYFVIEKKIKIPQVVYTVGGIDESIKKYSLIEILNTKDFEYADVEINEHKFDRSKARKAKNDVLNYLKTKN